VKRILLVSILGVVASAAPLSLSATGYVPFSNYNSVLGMPVQYSGLNPDVATSNVHVDLFYHLGVTTDPNQLIDLNLSVPIDPSLDDGSGWHGYFNGPLVTIPDYTSGPITFMVRGWDTTTGATYGAAGLKGQSFLWQEPYLLTSLSSVKFFEGLPGPSGAPLLVLAPEPSTLAIMGLAALLVAVRRQVLNSSN
jgi:hypothetical protein